MNISGRKIQSGHLYPLSQSMSTDAGQYGPLMPRDNSTPPLSVVLLVVLLVCFFVGLFAFYFCRCIMESIMRSWGSQANGLRPSGNQPVNPGLDLRIIQSFPLFSYTTVEDYRPQKYALECAICLSEFVDSDTLRLLTSCYHVFHQGCIDLWLESHKTCPVCRTDLQPSQTSLGKPPGNDSSEPAQDLISITVEDNSEIQVDHIREASSEERLPMESMQTLSRSHSTGHSVIGMRPEEGHKYRLGLPDHALIKATRRHNQTESCIAFGELTRSGRVERTGTFGVACAASS